MWLSTRARITGSSHIRDMLPCQDFAECQISSNCMLCVVSDGASTAPLGEIGASIAVESIKQYFAAIPFNRIRAKCIHQIGAEIKQNYFRFLHRKMNQLYFPTQLSDYAATVAFIAIFEPYDYFLCGVVGDCLIAKFNLCGRTDTISGKCSTGNKQWTDFISNYNSLVEISCGRLSEYRGFILTTDGCAKGGMLSSTNTFDKDVEEALFDNLPLTQNPEIWLTNFLLKNILSNTGDDLSMYVIYPELCPSKKIEFDVSSEISDNKNNRSPHKWHFLFQKLTELGILKNKHQL